MKSGYVGFWRRTFAYLLDIFFLGIIFLTFSNAMGYDLVEPSKTIQFVSFATSALYFIFFWSSQDGQTLGNRILKFKVIKENGQKMTFADSIIRYIGLALSFAILGLGVVWAAFDKRKQGLHDKFARTLVVETGKANGWMVFLLLLVFGAIYLIYLSAFFFSSWNRVNQVNSANLASETFVKVNEYRKNNGLPEFKVDSPLCAYAQRRLGHYNELGKNDDGKGFYEDMANQEILRAYFFNNPRSGQMFREIGGYVTPDEIVNGWTSLENSLVKEKYFTNGCIRSDDKFMIFILGGN